MNHILNMVMLATAVSFSLTAHAEFRQADLPYPTNALEPAIDQVTMDIHYGKHHKAYVDNLNAQIKNYPALDLLSIEALQAQISQYNTAVRNNAGGHFNHSFFWQSLAPKSSKTQPSAQLLKQITQDFASFENFQQEFNAAATGRFGSGWAWLILTPTGKLAISSTANQDNPLMDIAEVKGQPLLALDVWEHAYYLKYQNRRADYTQAFWSVVNWDQVNQRYNEALIKQR